MISNSTALWMLEQEARSLLTRLARVKPFVLHETMVPAAAVSLSAQTAIERYLTKGRHELRELVYNYLGWLHGPGGIHAPPSEVHRRFTFLRMRFNAVLTQFDIFADVMTQRSEHETGVWLAGLDVVAADSLELQGRYYETPPVVCYLDRGVGAAIRRARTRLPGGGENPVAIIRVPRERMVGSGIASSLVHEVGHQASVLLDLIGSMRPLLVGMQKKGGKEKVAWTLWERWISEILADFWSVARVGIASTVGLMGIASLPRAFVFRINMADPHPFPWIRVKISCAIGHALYPHPQWNRLAELWESFYPRVGLDEKRENLIAILEATMPSFVSLLANHRPKALRGNSLIEALSVEERQPARLSAYYQAWRTAPARMRTAPPCLVFAVIGQTKADGKMSPAGESNILSNLLTHWAVQRTLNTSAICAKRPVVRMTASVT